MTDAFNIGTVFPEVSTHMPLARHDNFVKTVSPYIGVSTHMPLARHDQLLLRWVKMIECFYSHASCEA